MRYSKQHYQSERWAFLTFYGLPFAVKLNGHGENYFVFVIQPQKTRTVVVTISILTTMLAAPAFG